jgi:hypothetical protein
LGVEVVLVKIYCDTDTLFHNAKRQEKESKTRRELVLANLTADYDQLPQISNDERFYRTERIITDPHGGFIGNPLVSDVQDEAILAELVERGLEFRDAEHIAQAICHLCDVFLTLATVRSPRRSSAEPACLLPIVRQNPENREIQESLA